MSPDSGQKPREDLSSHPITVYVEQNTSRWEVTLPNDSRRVTCEIVDDARRVEYLCAAHTRRRELIVHDSRHRRLDHELIEYPPQPILGGEDRDPPGRRLTLSSAGTERSAIVKPKPHSIRTTSQVTK